jgi:hypothetical protein
MTRREVSEKGNSEANGIELREDRAATCLFVGLASIARMLLRPQ